MMNHKVYVLTVVSLLVSSCMPVAVSPTAEAPEPATTTSELISTPARTANALSPAPTFGSDATPTPESILAVTPSPTMAAATNLTIRCPEIRGELQRPEGLLVLLSYDGSTISFLDIRTGTQISSPQRINRKSLPSVSPSGKWLAYVEEGSDPEAAHLITTSSDSKPSIRTPWENDWRIIAGWLDDERLIISKKKGANSLDSLVILNPFTGAQYELPSSYPSIWAVTPRPEWDGFGLAGAIYDASLNYVAYARYSEDSSGEATAIGIWDIKAGREITRLDGTTFFGRTPKWSRIGPSLALANSLSVTLRGSETIGTDQEIFVVSATGQLAQITQLTKAYEAVKIGSMSWSPSSERIAFWLEAEPRAYPKPWDIPDTADPQRLAIVDTNSLEVVDYCLPGDKYSGLSSDPIWSSDGRYVITESRTGNATSRIFLLDTLEGFAVQIAEDVRPIGLMTATP